MNIVFEVSWRTQTMTGRLEIISEVGLFCRAWLFFSVHISADSCTLNFLYVISKLSCNWSTWVRIVNISSTTTTNNNNNCQRHLPQQLQNQLAQVCCTPIAVVGIYNFPCRTSHPKLLTNHCCLVSIFARKFTLVTDSQAMFDIVFSYSTLTELVISDLHIHLECILSHSIFCYKCILWSALNIWNEFPTNEISCCRLFGFGNVRYCFLTSNRLIVTELTVVRGLRLICWSCCKLQLR